MERPHTHFLPGAAKARKMTSFLEKVFQGRGGIREKMWGGGSEEGRAERTLHPPKSISSGPCSLPLQISQFGSGF